MGHEIKWFDQGRDPKVAPNPAYPDGKDIDISVGAKTTCTVTLDHPTKRCGFYAITCNGCGLSVAVTTAGRPDDPRSVRMACKPRFQ